MEGEARLHNVTTTVFRKVIFISRESHHSHSAKAVVHLVSTEKHPTKETPPAALVLH